MMLPFLKTFISLDVTKAYSLFWSPLSTPSLRGLRIFGLFS